MIRRADVQTYTQTEGCTYTKTDDIRYFFFVAKELLKVTKTIKSLLFVWTVDFKSSFKSR